MQTSVAFIALSSQLFPRIISSFLEFLVMIPSRAMKRVAMSLSKLADIAREELPSTTAAIRLSSMEIAVFVINMTKVNSSQDIADGIIKSAQALQAAEAGIQQIGSCAQGQAIRMS
ncbi:hypothetical protein EUGRSUZ_L02757 [Eucalyptus grandis]|uniref:Uncharacterized protein n=1 Tax=Eucalyptus grandis TaxID=71139 RepID=A0AAD9T999_EUCGR|nr:hypothetical protein EUGRSUZ_L02757 [Eucalyptus grandis]